jgi:hypothetical protein
LQPVGVNPDGFSETESKPALLSLVKLARFRARNGGLFDFRGDITLFTQGGNAHWLYQPFVSVSMNVRCPV